jgi:hypothetical protein
MKNPIPKGYVRCEAIFETFLNDTILEMEGIL